MRRKSVSIIIPNWNGRNFLKPCLDSVFHQDYDNFDVIFVDCASTDGSANVVKQNYPEVKIIELKEDKGPTNALNLGISISNGSYIMLLNNDVILPAKCLGILVAELQEEENSVISPVELDWDRKYRRAGGVFSFLGGHFYKFFGIRPATPVSPFWPLAACCICTKQTLLDTPLNEHLFMYEELEWGWRLHLKKYRVKISFNTFFMHKGEGTKTGGSPRQAFLFSRLMISTCFICLSVPSFFLLSPFIALYYFQLGLPYVTQHELNSFIAYLRGFLDFWLNIEIFMKDRKRAQKERLVNDWEIIKIMEGSLMFQRISKEKWSKQGTIENDG